MPALYTRLGTSLAPLWMAGCVTLLSACGASTSDIAAPASPAPPKPIAAPQVSQWSPSVPLSIVPWATANLPNGQVRLWAHDEATSNREHGAVVDFDPASFMTIDRPVETSRGERCAESGPTARMTRDRHPAGARPSERCHDVAPWLFAAPNGQVLQGGMGTNLRWIDPRAPGGLTPTALQGGDAGAASGRAAMFDSGRILAVDAAPRGARVIDVQAGLASRDVDASTLAGPVRDAVVLPNGEVLVLAERAVLWNPKTERFMPLPAFDDFGAGRSLALLLPDARLLVPRQPACHSDCARTAADLRILTPHYLLNADGSPAHRPVISEAPASATHGTRIDVHADPAIDQFVLVRTPTASRPDDREQRRIVLPFSRIDDGDYSLSLPANPGVMLPGDYLLFALDAAGVPSVASTIHIGRQAAPALVNPGPQVSSLNAPALLATHAATPGGRLSFSASGLPPGLEIDPATGTISGTPSKEGEYSIELSASNGTATTATMLAWSIDDAAARASWVRLETRAATNDDRPMAIETFDVLGRDGAPITRDSRRLASSDNPIRARVSLNTRPFASDAEPRGLTIDLGARQAITGFRVAQRSGGAALATWRFFTSDDGSRWTLAASGHFKRAGTPPAEQTVMLNRLPSLAPLAAISTRLGETALLAVSASDADGDVLHFSADGLPRGVAINPATGLISGTPIEAGAALVTVLVSDGSNPPVSGSFDWQVSATSLVIEPVLATPQAAGSSVGFTVHSNRAAARYRWRFGDGSAELPVGSATMVSHVYTTPGLYAVTVSAMDASGERERRTFMQAIYASPGVAPRPLADSAVSARHPTGAYWFVAPAAAHSVAIIDPVRRAEIYRFDAGQAIDRLAVSADGLRLYAQHSIDRSVSVFDLSKLVNYGELNVRLMAASNR